MTERSSEYKVAMAYSELLASVEFCVFMYKTAKTFVFLFKPQQNSF